MIAAWRRRSHRQQENETGITGLTARRDCIRGERSRDAGRTGDETAPVIQYHSSRQGRRHRIVFDGSCDSWAQGREGRSHSTFRRTGV